MSEIITLPGLIDVHVHFREPSTNKSETIENGSKAALIGGFAVACDMPNNPGNPTWSEAKIDEKLTIVEQGGTYNIVEFYSGSQPESDNIPELKAMSAKSVGLKLYGAPTTGNIRNYEASDFEDIVAEWSSLTDKPILFHAGSDNLEGMVDLVANKYRQDFHVCHVNDPRQVSVVKEARDNDLSVTCGVCPHHLIKTSHDEKTEGEFARMQPPLAHQEDSEKLMYLLNRGDIQIIESDYAPHSMESKWQAEDSEGHCFGVSGIEHIVPIFLRLAKKGSISMERLVDALHTQPAQLLDLKLPKNTYSKWELRDYRIDSEEDLVSGPKWSPYLGKLAAGKIQEMKIGGKILISGGDIKRRYHEPL